MSSSKEWLKQIKDWQNRLKQDDGQLLKEIQTKTAVSKFHQSIFLELKKVADDNLLVFCQISQFLMTKNASERGTFYFPVIFNHIIKLSKEALYNEALAYVSAFNFDNLGTDHEVRIVLQLVQQILYMCNKDSTLKVPELDFVMRKLEDAIPYIRTSGSLLETFDLFLKKRGCMNVLIQAQGTHRLKAFLNQLLSEDFTFDASTKTTLQKSAFSYVETMISLCLQHAGLDGIYKRVAQQFNGSVLKLDLLLAYLNFLHKSRKTFDHKAFTEFDAAVRGVKDTHSRAAIESTIIIVSTFKEVSGSLKAITDGDVVLILMKLIQRLVNIAKNHDGNALNSFCRTCQSTKRHAIVSIINEAVDIFVKVGQNIVLKENHGLNLFAMLEFTFKTLEGLECETSLKYGRNILVQLFNIVTCYKLFDEIPEIKLKLVELFRSYVKIYPGPTLDPAKTLRCYVIGYEGSDPVKVLDAICMNFLIQRQSDHAQDCNQMSLAVKARKNVSNVDQSIAQIMTRQGFNTFDMRAGKVHVPQMILLEMEYNFRVSASNLELFNALRESTDNVELLSIALFMIDIEEHKLIADKALKFIEERLCKLDTAYSQFGLGIIKYRRYFHAFDQLYDEFKAIKADCSDGETYATSVKVVERFSVAAEEAAVAELKESFTHFKRGFGHGELDSRYSCMKIVKMLETIAAHFRMRNYAYEAMEVQIFACNVAKKRATTMEWPILQSYSAFLEDIDQYLVHPAKSDVTEIVNETYAMVIKFMKTFETLKIYRQSVIMSVLLSLARYYLRIEKRQEAMDLLRRYREADKTLINLHQQNESIFRMHRIRYYITFYEIFETVTDSNLRLHQLAVFIVQEFGEIKEYRTEYSIHLPTLMFKTVTKMGFSALCRSDTTSLESYVMMIYKYALKFGLSMRCVQILNLVAQIAMARENLIDAELKLQCLNAFCNFETPVIEIKPTTKSLARLNTKAPEFATPTLECEIVRRDVGQQQKSKNRTSPEAFLGLKKYFVHDNTSAQMQFYSFLIGATYARLLYMNDDFKGALNFYQLAQNFWPQLETKLLNAKIPEIIKEFRFFSYMINLQHCDCLMSSRKTAEAYELLDNGRNLLDDPSMVEDHEVLLRMRVETSKTTKAAKPTFETFESLIKPPLETPRAKPKVTTTRTTRKVAPSTVKKFPVYVDSPVKSTQKKRQLQYSAIKKSTLETSSTENTAVSLQDIPTTTKRLPKNKPSKVASAVKKTQLKFSPSIDSPDVVVVLDSENESPNRAKTPAKKDDSVVNASMETPVMASYSARRTRRNQRKPI